MLHEFHQNGSLRLSSPLLFSRANQRVPSGPQCSGYGLANSCLCFGSFEESSVCTRTVSMGRVCSVSSAIHDLPVEPFIAFNHQFYRKISFDPLPAPSPIQALDPVNRFDHFVLGA